MTNSFRFPGGLNPTTPAELDDNVASTIGRCTAIADLIAAVSNSEDCTVADGTISAAAYAIVSDLEDLQAIVRDWFERERVKMLAQRAETQREDRLRQGLMDILVADFPDEAERAAEVEKRMAQRA